jgi:hypothetical protein
MMRAAVGIALLLCGSLTLAAQNSATPRIKTVPACPIDMQANQGVWDHTIRVRETDKEQVLQPFGQRLSLILKDSHSARIQTATVRVDGLTGKNQMLQTDVRTSNADGIRTMTVRFASQDDGRVAADLWIPGFTSVTSIELLEVSYADGSTWKISGSNVCSVKPDPLMLISNR